jgi:hypothetical protein
MEQEKLPTDRVDQRFHGKVRHYHRKVTETSWDDWIGVKAKHPRRQQIDRIVLKFAVLLVGALGVCGILMVLYIVVKIILSISPS